MATLDSRVILERLDSEYEQENTGNRLLRNESLGDPTLTSKRVVILGTRGDYVIRHRGPLMRDLRNRGHEVWALAPGMSKEVRSTLETMGVRGESISLDAWGMNPFIDGRHLAALYKSFRRIRPDVLLAYAAKAILYGTSAARIAGVKRRFALFAGLGYLFSDPETARSRKRLLKQVATLGFRAALTQCNLVFFQNHDDQRLFTEQRIVAAGKTRVVPGSGVDLESFPWHPVPTSPVRFLMATRLLREKGVYEFIEAARRIRTLHPEVEFVLLGAPDNNPGAVNRSDLEHAAREGAIIWPGEVEDVRPWLELSTVYVLPSYYGEGVPRSTLEAMAMGRPVVTTNSVGCRETVTSGNGFLVNPRDVDGLVNALRSFVLQPQLAKSMGSESRRVAETRFDVRLVNRLMIEAMGL